MSLKDAYDLSLKHALRIIESNGGKVTECEVSIPMHTPQPVRMEAGFEEHHPVKRICLGESLHDEIRFDFEGVGFALTGEAFSRDEKGHIFVVQMIIDAGHAEKIMLPTNGLKRRATPFWKYRLSQGKHSVLLKVLNPTGEADIQLHDLIIYADKPPSSKHRS
jgi:hypothetical protein